MWQRVNAINELESEEARAIFGIPKDGRDWTVSAAKRDVAESGPSEQFVCELLYRPFDVRYTYWTGRTKGFLAYPRREVMQHVVGKHNVGLIFNRQIVGDDVSHFAVSNIPICHGTFYLGNKGQDYFAPLYVFEDSILGSGQQKRSNFSSLFQQKFCEALGINVDAFESIQAFNYLYAIFHSPQYRATYRHLIKVDFARVPLVSCASLFVSLVRLGDTLVRLHLMQDLSPSQFMTEFSGEPGCEVESVNYSNETVWLDQAATVGFKGVPENVWDFRIGGYQVCQKWLKDRQAKGGKNPRPGRILTEEDIAHYQKIIVAISETIRIMGEIDEVIEEHGGWPGAFQVDDDEQDAVPLRQAAEEKGKYEAED